jgi:hypothetical protein
MFDLDNPAIKRRLLKTTYAFDVTNLNFSRNNEHNLFYIRASETYFNEKLRAVGYVFLNEVLEHLGIAPTMVGQLVGWRKDAGDFITIKIVSTIYDGGDLKEYFLEIIHDGIIIDVLGD